MAKGFDLKPTAILRMPGSISTQQSADQGTIQQLQKNGHRTRLIASSEHNETTTLDEGGSIYCCHLSAALEVERLEIWSMWMAL